MHPTKQLSCRPSQIVALQETSIFVMGDIVLDAYVKGNVSRISPEAPVPVLLESEHFHVLGGASNPAANIATFGARSCICGRIGSDAEGAIFLELARKFGIETTACLVSSNIPTTRKTRIVTGAQQLVRVDREVCTAISPEEELVALGHLREFLSRPGRKCVLLSDYAKGFLTRTMITESIALCRKHNVPVATDPKSADLARYAGSAVIKPNFKEGREFLKALGNRVNFADCEEEFIAVSKAFLQASGAANVVLSLSEHGVAICGSSVQNCVRLATQALKVADVSGAGDTMIAFLAMGLAAELPLRTAAEFANIAAGIVCGKPGTATVSASEILSSLQEDPTHIEAETKMVSHQEITQLAKTLRAQGRRIVFTNGCFDILHAGHVRLLEDCKALGDVLIVGLNSDSSVQALKGPTRPVQNENDRSRIMASLASVDFVVLFEEETPLNLILGIRPHVLAKGGDWKIDDIVGGREVAGWGGDVVSLRFLDGRSTTNIINKAQL